MVSMSLLFNILRLHAPKNTPTCVFLSSKRRDKLQPQSRISLRDLQKSSTNSRPTPNATTNSAGPVTGPASSLAVHSEQPDTLLLSNLTVTAADPYDNISLADVTVPLESIKPSKQKKQWHAGCDHTVAAVLSLYFSTSFCFGFQAVYYQWLYSTNTASGFYSPLLVTVLHHGLMCWWWSSPCCPRPPVLSPTSAFSQLYQR